MRERPILFQADMVRGLLSDIKSQTRRLSGLDLLNEDPDKWRYDPTHSRVGSDSEYLFGVVNDSTGELLEIACPYGKAGDRLYVKETFSVFCVTDRSSGDGFTAAGASVGIGYRADHKTGKLADGDGGYNFRYVEGASNITKAEELAEKHYYEWRPSIFMPRWASRITLEITDVRVQRLQDISEEDAQAEGVEESPCKFCADTQGVEGQPCNCGEGFREAYSALWDEINGDGSWKQNPYVWAITFRRVA